MGDRKGKGPRRQKSGGRPMTGRKGGVGRTGVETWRHGSTPTNEEGQTGVVEGGKGLGQSIPSF